MMRPWRVRFCIAVLAGCNLIGHHARAVGTWTAVTALAPSSVNTMLLLPDGTVICADGNRSWYRLTPNINGSYVNGTWTTLPSMVDTRLYYASQVMTNGNVFIAGAEYGTGASS